MMDSREVKLHGVNLGGWLLLERWITPALFEGVVGKDETSFMRQLGEVEATKRLHKHHTEFITEADFTQISAYGLNAVRIPVGWWIFGDEAPYIGSVHVLDRALDWAQKYGIKVLIDLHGLPGSQNGKAHSGDNSMRLWHLSMTFQERSLWIIKRLAKQYANHPAVWGIQVINEPGYLTPSSVLAAYYQASLAIIRQYSPSVKVIFSDAFWGEGMLPHISSFIDQHTVLDVHLYQLYTPVDQKMSLDEHIQKAEHEWRDQLAHLCTTMPVIVGEWSAALGKLPELPIAEDKNYMQHALIKFAHTQQQVFKATTMGWFYWTYKTQEKNVWSLVDRPQYLIR